jgi:hypothetical protein
MAADNRNAPEDQIAFGLRMALLREPRPQEINVLTQLYGERLAAARQDPQAAQKLAASSVAPAPAGVDAPQLAALTAVANVILNLDEFLTKG